MELEEAKATMGDVSAVFGMLRLPVFPVCGTLLGYYREGGIIAHDKDLDFGTFIIEDPERIRQAFLQRGYTMKHILGVPGRGLEYSFKKNGVHFDLFFYYADEPRNMYWQPVWVAAENDITKVRMIKYNYPKFDLKPITFLGHPFMAPVNIEEILVTQYGTDWRIPKKEWSYTKSPKNMEQTDFTMGWVAYE